MSKTLSKLETANKRQPFVNVLRLASNVADAETVTIGNDVYEMDSASTSTITAGNIRVDVNSALTPTVASASLVAAINANANSPVIAVAISVNEVLIWTKPGQERAIPCTETLAGSNNAWAAAAMYATTTNSDNRAVAMGARVPNATEVAVGNMHFRFSFAVAFAIAVVRVTATGVLKAHDGALTISGNRVTLDNAGSTDWAATDTVTVIASQ
jgi:hypothetical protein